MSLKINVVTPKEGWFFDFALQLVEMVGEIASHVKLLDHHRDIEADSSITFLLSYPRLVKQVDLAKSQYTVVAHASALPQGRGWSPWVWQILEGKNKIPISLFEVKEELDSGDILAQDILELKGTELIEEIREKLALKICSMCVNFVEAYIKDEIIGCKQVGEVSYYPKRTAVESELNIHKSINEQFNLLRVVDNNQYPAFFYYRDVKYILKIYKEEKDV